MVHLGVALLEEEVLLVQDALAVNVLQKGSKRRMSKEGRGRWWERSQDKGQASALII